MDRQRLYVDMDGTLAEFKIVDTLETLYEQGYFLNLEPNVNVVRAVKEIIANNPEIEVHILSSVLTDSEFALSEKNAWLDKYLPEIDQSHRIFPPCGMDKKDFIEGGVRADDFLLDDYTHNLRLWQPPAKGIKILNGINHTNGSWEHDRIRFDKTPQELASNIIEVMKGTLRIQDEKPQRRNDLVANTTFKAHANPSRFGVADNEYFVQEYIGIEGTAEAEVGRIVFMGSVEDSIRITNQLNEGVISIDDAMGQWNDSPVINSQIAKNIAALDFANGVRRNAYASQQLTKAMESISEGYRIPLTRDYLNQWDIANTTDSFVPKLAILQLGEGEHNRLRRFTSLDDLQRLEGETPSVDNYEVVFIEKADAQISLPEVHRRFNADEPRPSNYYGHSLSVGDVVVIAEDGMTMKAHYVDDFGFKELDNFLNDRIRNRIATNMDIRTESDLIESIHRAGLRDNQNILSEQNNDRYSYINLHYLRIFELADKRRVLEQTDKLNAIFDYEGMYGGESNSDSITYYEHSLDRVMIKNDVFRNNSSEDLRRLVDAAYENALKDKAEHEMKEKGVAELANNDRKPFVPSKEQADVLNALYSSIVTRMKYPNDEFLQADITEKLKDYARELDALHVPFAVQNAVAGAGEISSNWDRYNNDVLQEVYQRGFRPQTFIDRNSEGIAIAGHRGTWHTIDSTRIDGQDYFLMEHDTYGDEAASIIVNTTGTMILDDVYNGFDDLRDMLDNGISLAGAKEFVTSEIERYLIDGHIDEQGKIVLSSDLDSLGEKMFNYYKENPNTELDAEFDYLDSIFKESLENAIENKIVNNSPYKDANLVASIEGVNFYNRSDSPNLIFTYDENYRIEIDENIEKACQRIFDSYYKDNLQHHLSLQNGENINTSNEPQYKFFYAGSGGQDQEAIAFQKDMSDRDGTGWKRIWGSDNDGLNGDTWVVYKDIEGLPKWLQEFAAEQERLGKVEPVILSSQESNFNIEKLDRGTFVVRSDSERFGKQAITFESFSRDECVDYIARNSEQDKPTYYIIEDLSTWANNAPVQSKLERFDTLLEAVNKFNEYRQNPYDYSDGKAKLTMGASVGSGEFDIVQVRNDYNYLVSDFMGSSRFNTNKEFLSDMAKLNSAIGFDKIRLHRDENGERLKTPQDINYSDWNNPFFSGGKVEFYTLNENVNEGMAVTHGSFSEALADYNAAGTVEEKSIGFLRDGKGAILMQYTDGKHRSMRDNLSTDLSAVENVAISNALNEIDAFCDRMNPKVVDFALKEDVLYTVIYEQDGVRKEAGVIEQAGRYYFGTGSAIGKDRQRHYLSDEQSRLFREFVESHRNPMVSNIEFQSASRSNYEGYVVLAQFDRNAPSTNDHPVYLGKAENYDGKGNYNNTDNSLMLVSENGKMFSMLSSSGWVVSQQEMIDNGSFDEKDYLEFAQLREGVLKDLKQTTEIKFSIDVSDPNSGVPFAYPNWNVEKELPHGEEVWRNQNGAVKVYDLKDGTYGLSISYGRPLPMIVKKDMDSVIEHIESEVGLTAADRDTLSKIATSPPSQSLEEYRYYFGRGDNAAEIKDLKGYKDMVWEDGEKAVTINGLSVWGVLTTTEPIDADTQSRLSLTPIGGEERSEKTVAKQEKVTDNISKSDEEVKLKDKVAEQLKEGIQNVMESEQFRNWCKTSGKLYFTNYSFRNAMLTYIQKPTSTYVMGYEAWKEYGRQVAKGASGIKIFTPAFAKEYTKGGLYKTIRNNLNEQLKKDPQLPYAVYRLGQSKLAFTMQHNGIMGLQVDNRDVQRFNSEDEVKKFIDRNVLGKVPMYYSVGTVFDVSDTIIPEHIWLKNGFKKEELALNENGDPIKTFKGEFKVINTPERQARFNTNLDLTIPEGDAEKMGILFDVLQKVSADRGVPMTLETIEEDGCKGFYQRPKEGESGEGRIAIHDGLAPTERVATAFHEIAHSDMHRDLAKLSAEMGEKVDRSMREVQAEAVSYMTASNFGISTDTSSFNYLAAWSKGKELKDLEKSLDVIFKASKALMKDIEKELDARGLDLRMELKDQEPLSAENRAAGVKEYTAFILQKSNQYDEITKDIMQDLSSVENTDELDIIKEQSLIVKEIKSNLSDMTKICDDLMKAEDRATQLHLMQKYSALYTRIQRAEMEFGNLNGARLAAIEEGKASLKKQFDKEPMAVLKTLQSTHESMKHLTEKDLSYIATSPYVARECTKLLKENPADFVKAVVNQVDNAKAVSSKNGTFVEVTFCEQWGENKIFEKGTVAHPKVANKIIEEAEMQTRSLKIEAEQKNDYYPYSKCKVTVYTPNNDNGYHALVTRVDIGDGYQKNLVDHLEKACENSKDKGIVLENVKAATRERSNVKDKIMTPQHAEQEVVVDEDRTHTIDGWKEKIENNRAEHGDEGDSQNRDRSDMSEHERG